MSCTPCRTPAGCRVATLFVPRYIPTRTRIEHKCNCISLRLQHRLCGQLMPLLPMTGLSQPQHYSALDPSNLDLDRFVAKVTPVLLTTDTLSFTFTTLSSASIRFSFGISGQPDCGAICLAACRPYLRMTVSTRIVATVGGRDCGVPPHANPCTALSLRADRALAGTTDQLCATRVTHIYAAAYRALASWWTKCGTHISWTLSATSEIACASLASTFTTRYTGNVSTAKTRTPHQKTLCVFSFL